MTRLCVTHHHACDCREQQFQATRAAARDVLTALDFMSHMLSAPIPEHLRPDKMVRALRDLVGFCACSVCSEPVVDLTDATGTPGGPWFHNACGARAERLYDEAQSSEQR